MFPGVAGEKQKRKHCREGSITDLFPPFSRYPVSPFGLFLTLVFAHIVATGRSAQLACTVLCASRDLSPNTCRT
jgi:hypothetical protein